MPEHIIHEWMKISERFMRGGLILGNGASIAIDKEHFSYKSILDEARKLELITPYLDKIFKVLKTTDFERVLSGIWQTKYINEALSVESPEILKAYNDIQKALIETVRCIHHNVPYESVEEKLKIASSFLAKFKIVLSLNYDVLVYWSILLGNDLNENHFSDCFVHHSFRYDWIDFLDSHKTLVFYPHGNLVIGRDFKGVEYKIHTVDRKGLLDTIFQIWNKGIFAPVFVSEGYSDQKILTIRRSPYLSTIYNHVIPYVNDSIVIYGWSLSKHDYHLIEAINGRNIKRFAVSIHSSSGDPQEKCALFEKKLREKFGTSVEIVFFDSESSDCWIYQ